jgi:hypothetical protein
MLTISWSTIDQYHKCPFRVKYELEGIPHSLSWAMAYASCGHTALKAWANDEDWMAVFLDECSKYEHRTAYAKNWNQKFTDNDAAVVQKMQIKSLLKQYTSTVPEKPDPQMVELQLSKDLGDDILLTGRIDAGWPSGAIIDWKFTKNPRYLSPIQAIIYSILNGGPSEFEYHAMVKDRSPYWDAIPVPETQSQENLDRVIKYMIKPIAKRIQLCIEDPSLWEAHPHEFLCQERYCGYWEHCQARFGGGER